MLGTLFVRRALPDLYFNRVPSPPATDDGSARPLAGDLSTGSDATRSEPVKHVSELA